MLDLDATDIPLYGHQPEGFFHGYYDSCCYLPSYIFAGDQLLCARLRAANKDAAAGAVEGVSRTQRVPGRPGAPALAQDEDHMRNETGIIAVPQLLYPGTAAFKWLFPQEIATFTITTKGT